MGYTDKRVGLSYISDKSDLSSLYNEEILVDKLTGDVYVKTPTKGNVISFNYLTRTNTHIQTLTSKTYSYAMMKSKIMKLTPDGMDFPATSGILNINLIGDTPVDIAESCPRVLLSIDIDCVDVTSGKICNNTRFDIPITYELMSTYFGDPVRIYSGETTLAEFNNIAFEFPERNDNIVITKLIIGESPQASSVRYILNAIYGLFNTNDLFSLRSINVVHQHRNEQFRTLPFNPDGISIEGVVIRGGTIPITDYTYEIFYINGDELIPDANGNNVFRYDGPHRIVFTYGKLTTSYDFDVSREVLVELYMVNPPDTLSYEVGDELDTTGLTLRGVYNTGVVADITDYNISGFDSNSPGSCCITIGCESCSVECTVDVLPCMWIYVIINSEVTITNYLGRNRVVNIPSTLDGLPVVAIERYTFYENEYVRVVNIPDTVRYIG